MMKAHQNHHQAVEEYMRGHEPHKEMHVMPNFQSGHIPHPWCFCVPTREDVPTFDDEVHTVWSHRVIIH